MKRHEPNIQKLAREYNRLCTEIAKLISEKRAPNHAVAPHQIDLDCLFDLDVDDDIWQDVGLDEDESPDQQPPPWMSEESVRDGIRALLELDRCWEEEARLVHERRALQIWFSEEWRLHQDAFIHAGMCSQLLVAMHRELRFAKISDRIVRCPSS